MISQKVEFSPNLFFYVLILYFNFGIKKLSLLNIKKEVGSIFLHIWSGTLPLPKKTSKIDFLRKISLVQSYF